jgi:hypothetical protein
MTHPEHPDTTYWRTQAQLEDRRARGVESELDRLRDREEQLEGLLELAAGMLLHNLETGEELTRNQKGLVVLGAQHLGLSIRPLDKTQAT